MDEALRLQEKMFVIDQMPVFAGLQAEDKRLVATSSLILEYKKGDIVYKEDDPVDGFYCVITGRLKVYITRPDGKREDLEYIKRGKYFGIISILTGEPHSTTVQAINDSIILKIDNKDFETILKHIPRLAIHLGQTLSRRLKRKDLHEKKIFESTIIAIFGTSDSIGTENYVLSLAIGLKDETHKKVIVLNIGKAGENQMKGLHLDSPYFDEKVIASSIFKHPLGIDMINISHAHGDVSDVTHIIHLLSYLTNDYHYLVVDLPGYMDKLAFETLKQSDMIHLITGADESSLCLTEKFISELEKSSDDAAARIKVIISEYGVMKLIDFENRRAILKHDVFATLPDICKLTPEIDSSKAPVVSSYPECDYSKAMRRISREIGERLIGLALGCGASLAIAHAGVLKVIEREKIPIDIVVGTSMGALMGALWASGMDADDIERIVNGFKRKMKTFGLIDLTFPRIGLLKGRQVRRFLRSQFGDMTFRDLRIPFKAVACDIEKRQEVVIDKGSLADAIFASVAIPGVLEPIRINGRLLVDGGVVNPLPVNVLTRMGVSKIIAVNALPSPEDIQKSRKRMSNIFDVMINSMQASEYLLAEMSCQNADIAMHPVLPTVEWYAFYEGSRFIKRGEEEALKYLTQMKELVVS